MICKLYDFIKKEIYIIIFIFCVLIVVLSIT